MSESANTAGKGPGALDQAALSDVGLRRANNQDSFAVVLAANEHDWHRRGHLFVVADGMGAHAAGELASKMACETIGHTYRKITDRPPAEALRQSVETANANIHARGQANAEFQGMGTTTSALILMPDVAIVAHVGDSRIYRLRNQKLEQLTFDHSLVWEMLAQGQMPSGEVANFIPKNIITRSLGPHAEVRVDLEGPFALAPGDTFFLCSDGLSGQLKDEEIGVLLGVLTPTEAVRTLVDVSNLRGGPDNITAIVVRVGAVPSVAGEVTAQPASQPPASPARTMVWAAMAVCVLITLVLAVTEHYLPAMLTGLLAAATVVVALLQNLTGETPQTTSYPDSGPLGKGPHVTRDCTPNAESVTVLAQMAQQLRDAAKEEHWTLDWHRFNALGEEAQAARAAGNFSQAVRQYALAISFMMSEIRRQPAHGTERGRSVLDL